MTVIDSTTTSPDLTDPTGAMLFRDIDTQVQNLLRRIPNVTDRDQIAVDVVLPGSLRDSTTIERSSRLNVREPCNLNDCLGDRAGVYELTNDVYASALGQLDHSLPHDMTARWADEVVLFIYVDEGVGSLIFHKNEVIRGVGFAGPLGHCIVERNGQYFDDFRARGALESYCSRPWISANMVNLFFTERDKETSDGTSAEVLARSPLRRALNTIALSEKRTLDYELIDQGFSDSDPIAVRVLREAADYLGLAISHLIVTLNPHLIVLDGPMFHRVSGFFDETVESTRRYTWVDAWNVTNLVRSPNDPNSPLHGVAYAARENLSYHQR